VHGRQTAYSYGSHASWKFLKVLEFSPLSRAWKVLEINVGSGKFWKFDVKSWKVVELALFLSVCTSK